MKVSPAFASLRKLDKPPPESKTNSSPIKSSKKKIALFKIFLLLGILFAGFSVGFCLFTIIHSSREQVYRQNYDSMVGDNHRAMTKSLSLKTHVNSHLALNFGINIPEASWPYCRSPSKLFHDQISFLLSISDLDRLALAPIVYPAQRAAFENYSKAAFLEDGYPEGTGGPGIYSLDKYGNPILRPLHSNTTRLDLTAPLIQLSDYNGEPEPLLYDLYSSPFLNPDLDQILRCVSSLPSPESYSSPTISAISLCTTVSDFIPMFNTIGVFVASPIIPYHLTNDPHDNFNVLGFSIAQFTWLSALNSTIVADAQFDCTISSSSSSLQLHLRVKNGQVYEINKINSNSARTFPLAFGSASDDPQFTITYYATLPHPSLFLPLFAFFCCFGITLLISGVFISFNDAVNQEAHDSETLLNSKRVFVRFISHEIR
jgi:hypothetical protein